jgi:hypothetical protein
MVRATGLTRFLWRLTALLQLCLPLAVSAVDAQLEREASSARAVSHIEASTGQDCARTHQPECALCQHLASSLTKPDKPAPPIAFARVEHPLLRDGHGQATLWAQQPSLPRAPPNA